MERRERERRGDFIHTSALLFMRIYISTKWIVPYIRREHERKVLNKPIPLCWGNMVTIRKEKKKRKRKEMFVLRPDVDNPHQFRFPIQRVKLLYSNWCSRSTFAFPSWRFTKIGSGASSDIHVSLFRRWKKVPQGKADLCSRVGRSFYVRDLVLPVFIFAAGKVEFFFHLVVWGTNQETG